MLTLHLLHICLFFIIPSQILSRSSHLIDSLLGDSIIRWLFVWSSVGIRSWAILFGVLWLSLWVWKFIREIAWLIAVIRWLIPTIFFPWWWRTWLYWNYLVRVKSCNAIWSRHSKSRTLVGNSNLINHVIGDRYLGSAVVTNTWGVVAWGIGSRF